MHSIKPKDYGFSLLFKGVLFFSVTLLLTLLLAAAVYYELDYSSISGLATADTMELSSVSDDNSPDGLRNPLLLLTPFAVLLVTLISGLLFFIRHIAVPLDNISRATRRMTNGLLDKPILVAERDEIGRVGEFINDLAMNMQEVLLYFWNHNQESRRLLDRLEKRMSDHPGRNNTIPLDEEIITQLKQGNNDVKSMILFYDFYDLKLEKEKMLINSQVK